MDIPVEDLEWVAHNPKDAMALFIAALKERRGVAKEVPSGLFETMKARTVSPPSVFIAKKHFRSPVVDGVRIYSLGEDFKHDFLGIEERDTPGIKLRMHKLKKGAYGETVYQDLDGGEIALGHFWELLKSNPRPFVAAPCRGQFVFAHWRIDRNGWLVDACPFTSRRLRMEMGDRVATG